LGMVRLLGLPKSAGSEGHRIADGQKRAKQTRGTIRENKDSRTNIETTKMEGV